MTASLAEDGECRSTIARRRRAGALVPRLCTIPVHLTGIHLPGAAFELCGRVVAPVSLGFGELGRDPEFFCSADAESVDIDVHIGTRVDDAGVATYFGPYVQDGHQHQALVIQWGVLSPKGTFLLFHGAQLRLPILDATQAQTVGQLALRATLNLSDPRGGPLRGIMPAAEIGWSLYPRAATARLVPSSE
jgi:Family of unknown function (DUF5990)